MTGCTLRRFLALQYIAVYRIDGSIVAVKEKQNSAAATIKRSLYFNFSEAKTIVHPGCAILKPVTLAKNSTRESINESVHDVINIPARILPANRE